MCTQFCLNNKNALSVILHTLYKVIRPSKRKPSYKSINGLTLNLNLGDAKRGADSVAEGEHTQDSSPLQIAPDFKP